MHVTLCSKQQAQHILPSDAGRDYGYVIAITDPGKNPAIGYSRFKGKKICLQFHSTVDPNARAHPILPTQKHAEELADFLRKRAADATSAPLLIHGEEGLNRAGAVALAALFLKHGASRKAAVEARELWKNRIDPDPFLITLLDTALDVQGRLIKANRMLTALSTKIEENPAE